MIEVARYLKTDGAYQAMVCREGRWVLGVVAVGGEALSGETLRRLARAFDADPLRAAAEGFGLGGLEAAFVAAGPPGVVAGASAGCRTGPLVWWGTEGGGRRGGVTVPAGSAVAWGPGGPEVVVDLVSGEARLVGPEEAAQLARGSSPDAQRCAS